MAAIGTAALLWAAATGALEAQAQAQAQAYPLKPLKLVLPYPAGGGTDVLARLVAQKPRNFTPTSAI